MSAIGGGALTSPAGEPLRGGRTPLFQRGVDRRESVIKRGAQTVHRGDDRQRDPGRNQGIFNRGSPRLIRQKRYEPLPQVRAPSWMYPAPSGSPNLRQGSKVPLIEPVPRHTDAGSAAKPAENLVKTQNVRKAATQAPTSCATPNPAAGSEGAYWLAYCDGWLWKTPAPETWEAIRKAATTAGTLISLRN
jgi:hypothetical protein